MNRKPVHLLIATAIALCLALPAARAQTFQGLGFLDSSPSSNWSEAFDVSADGSVVVGWAAGGGFRWSAGTMTLLPPAYPQYPYGTLAHGVSADGTIAVGWSAGAYVGQQRAATRWTGTAPTMVGPLVYAIGYATSDDGSVVVGSYSTQTLRAVDGAEPRYIEIGRQSTAWDVSADGAVMVGDASHDDGGAWRWENDDVEFLPPLPGETWAQGAYGISSDGTIIVGSVYNGSQQRMVRWVNKVPEDLGADGVAKSTSANGQVIVGDNDATPRRALIWTPARGAEDLRTHLIEQYGLDLTGWILESAIVSADGGTVVGRGRNPDGDVEAYRATFRGGNDIIVNVDGDEADASDADSVCDVDLDEPTLQCTLRAALKVAMAKPGSRIVFDIPGEGVPRIVLRSALPALTVPVQINATTQAGGFVEVRGGAGFDGLRLGGGGSSVKGLILNNFTRTGEAGGGAIVLTGAGGNTITGNYIGTDVAGNAAMANRSGIVIDGSPNNTIGGAGADANLISGNEYGVQLRGAGGNRVLGNRIGLAANGGFLRNAVGVQILDNSSNTIVGGTHPNLIASREFDVIVGATTGPVTDTEISGNFMGLDEAGTGAGNPVKIYTGIAVTAGAQDAAAITALRILDNRIAGPSLGIWIAGAYVREAEVAGNRIGLVFTDTGALPSGINTEATSIGIRTEGAPGTVVKDNLIASQNFGILAAGSLQVEEVTNDDVTTYRLYGPNSPLSNDPGTGNDVRITGNTIGLNALNAKPRGASQDYGISVFGGADSISIGNNTVAGHTGANIWLSESSNLTVAGNRIGTADGTDHGSVLGIWVKNVDTATIGGPGLEARNIISRHSDAGILIEGGSRTIAVLNNHIGTDISGAVAWANGVGIRVLSDSEGIEGLGIRDNIIGGNTGLGLDIDNAVNTRIVDNRIGVSSGGIAIPNGMGIHLGSTPALVSGNHIAHNDGPAIGIAAAAVQITGNFIYENDAGIVYGEAPFNPPAGVLVMRTDPTDQDRVGVFVAVAPTGAPGEVTLEIFGNRNCENAQGRVLLLKRAVAGNKPMLEFFSTESWNSFGTMNGFTVTATRGSSTSSFSPCGEAQPFADSDDDGASDLFEFLGGDRNGDGIADIDQRNVATHVSASTGGDLQVVTLVSAPGTTIQQSAVITDELPPIEGVVYMIGLALFDIQGVPSGTQTTLDILLESGRPAQEQRYIKLRSVTDTEVRFMPDSGTGDRAERTDTGWRLHLTDGGEWDLDGAANGRIRDPGGPVLVEETLPETPVTPVPPEVVVPARRGGGGSLDLALCLLLGALAIRRMGPRPDRTGRRISTKTIARRSRPGLWKRTARRREGATEPA